MNDSIFEIQADFCKTMGNAARLKLLHALRQRPMKVGDLVKETGFGQSLVSRHLGTLRNTRVVTCERHGTEMVYQLADERIGEVCDLVRTVLSTQMHRQTNVIFASDNA
ncbi:MAG: winged helix-turn-helix transcriptional regulator [Chloroflexi bacterium]|nr:winged helix-turn-helix transcriptional regulator [Chloroflexota bacterium]MBI3168614.1 winged helix-turn-helix transcriptional regulator [Chloroflexota bacterium]